MKEKHSPIPKRKSNANRVTQQKSSHSQPNLLSRTLSHNRLFKRSNSEGSGLRHTADPTMVLEETLSFDSIMQDDAGDSLAYHGLVKSNKILLRELSDKLILCSHKMLALWGVKYSTEPNKAMNRLVDAFRNLIDTEFNRLFAYAELNGAQQFLVRQYFKQQVDQLLEAVQVNKQDELTSSHYARRHEKKIHAAIAAFHPKKIQKNTMPPSLDKAGKKADKKATTTAYLDCLEALAQAANAAFQARMAHGIAQKNLELRIRTEEEMEGYKNVIFVLKRHGTALNPACSKKFLSAFRQAISVLMTAENKDFLAINPTLLDFTSTFYLSTSAYSLFKQELKGIDIDAMEESTLTGTLQAALSIVLEENCSLFAKYQNEESLSGESELGI